MAKLGAKPHLVASLNVMVAAQHKKDKNRRLSPEEIAEIVTAMAETEARLANPPKTEPDYWQPTPPRIL